MFIVLFVWCLSVSGRLDQTAHISVIFGRPLPLSLEMKTDIVTSSTSSEHCLKPEVMSGSVFKSHFHVENYLENPKASCLSCDNKHFCLFRLNITPPASPVFGASSQSSRRSVKRLRPDEETVGTKYSSQGYIQIKEANADGRYVKLFNSGAKVSFLRVFKCNICILC